MTSFEWSENLSTGNKQIDDEHKEILELLRCFHEVLEISASTRPQILSFLAGLHERLEHHFQYEEGVMREAAYPGYESHRHAHKEFLDDLTKAAEAFAAEQGPVQKSLVHFAEWAHQHIQTADQELAEFLRCQPPRQAAGG